MRRKPKGWRNEPGRHSLAARGVKTTWNDVPFVQHNIKSAKELEDVLINDYYYRKKEEHGLTFLYSVGTETPASVAIHDGDSLLAAIEIYAGYGEIKVEAINANQFNIDYVSAEEETEIRIKYTHNGEENIIVLEGEYYEE